jgi:hypothetical protein
MPNLHRGKSKYHIHDINNFLKTDAEIAMDFTVRIHHVADTIDRLQADGSYTHDRIIKKTIESGTLYHIHETSLYLEENY